MSKIDFQEITIKAVRVGKCEKCGKRWRKTKSFTQTVNPFNRTALGAIKNSEEVYEDVRLEASNWQPKHCA